MKEHCQRLEDEIRDLKLDNIVKEAKIRNWRAIERNSFSSHVENLKELQNGVSRPSAGIHFKFVMN